MGKFVCILGVIFLTVVYQTTADITATECTVGHADNGDAKCQDVDEHAECPGNDNDASNCACTADYFISSDKTKCIQKITTVVCTPGTTGTAACQQVDAHSECKTDDTACTCKEGYIGTDSCAKVLGGTCPTEGECSGSVANSECKEQKCECAANFIEESAICKTALGKECSGTGQSSCVSNAGCADNECKCLSGFKDTNGLCAAESSATSAWMASSLLVTSLLIYLPTLIMW